VTLSLRVSARQVRPFLNADRHLLYFLPPLPVLGAPLQFLLRGDEVVTNLSGLSPKALPLSGKTSSELWHNPDPAWKHQGCPSPLFLADIGPSDFDILITRFLLRTEVYSNNARLNACSHAPSSDVRPPPRIFPSSTKFKLSGL